MDNEVDNVKAVAEPGAAATDAKKAAPSRKRYSRAQLMHFRDTIDLAAPPVRYNPAVLRPVEPLNKDIPQAPREGQKWNRSHSLGGWAAKNQGMKQGTPPFSRLVEGADDMTNGSNRGGRALRSAISWNEQQAGAALAAPDKAFGRRNFRSDAPERWDSNKEDQLSKSAEKRGPEKWMSYGHRDGKDKLLRQAKEDECIENPPQEQPYRGHEPEWMHHRPSAENAERMKQHRQFAADFEEERKLMRQKVAKDGKGTGERGEGSMFMTDEEINEYKKELEAEERGVSSSAFSFDALKEAMKSQGVSNLPPMPTSGMSTVDQIEKTMKASATTHVPRGSMADLDRQKLELLKAVSGSQGNLMNPAAAATNVEGANRLLSMLRGQTRPGGSFGNFNPAAQLQQQMGGFPLNLQQQQGLLQGGNTQLERLFAANPGVGANLGLAAYGAQPPQMHPGMSNFPTLPIMQQAAQFNQRGGQQNALLSALMANQQQAQSARQKAQMMAHLQQAQRQTVMQNARGENKAVGRPEGLEENGDPKGNMEKPSVQQNMMGGLPGVTGAVPNQMPLHSFGLQGNAMGSRLSMPGGPGLFNPAMATNLPMSGGNPQDNLFPGGVPGGVNPAGFGGHPSLFMQSGGGVPNPVAPVHSGLNLNAMRPGVGASLGNMMDERQLPVLNGQPNALQASLLVAQQNNSGGLNRFFGEHNVGGAGAFPTEQPAVAPVRNRSLEELKNEAQ